jgi:hypothetical protein
MRIKKQMMSPTSIHSIRVTTMETMNLILPGLVMKTMNLQILVFMMTTRMDTTEQNLEILLV